MYHQEGLESGDSSDEESSSRRKTPSQTAEEVNLKRFTGIIQSLKTFKKSKDNDGKEQLRKFIEQQKGIYLASPDGSQMATRQSNILHIIAEQSNKQNKIGVSNFEPFIKAVTELHPGLLSAKNDDALTPIHLAIKKSSGRIVQYLSNALGDRLEEVIAMQDRDGNNCLHAAVLQSNSKSTITTELIPKVRSSEIYCAVNNKSLTPMHLAVDYAGCSEKLVKVVETMITHWDPIDPSHGGELKALDVHVLDKYHQSPGLRSVYRYHQHTCKQGRPQAQVDEVAKTFKSPKDTVLRVADGPRPEPTTSDTHRPQEMMKPDPVVPQPARPNKTRQGTDSNQSKQRSTADNHIDSKPIFCAATQNSRRNSIQNMKEVDSNKHMYSRKLDSILVDRKSGTSDLKAGAAEQKTGSLNSTPEMSGPKVNKNDDAKDRPRAAKQIQEKLKMHYMCSRSDQRQISQFLYEPHEGR